MSSAAHQKKSGAASFQTKVTASIMIVIAVLTALGLYLAERHVGAESRRELQQDFQAQLKSLHELQALRTAALVERCRVLAAKPRIHAALEDNALDLLYPSAKDELRDLLQAEVPNQEEPAQILHARFCRFLDDRGAVLRPTNPEEVGKLPLEAEKSLTLRKVPATQQIGYLPRQTQDGEGVDQFVATPIFSTESGEPISALVVGFRSSPSRRPSRSSLTSGTWVNGRLYMEPVSTANEPDVAARIGQAITTESPLGGNFILPIGGIPHLLLFTCLNRHSLYPAAYEICIYPLTRFEKWRNRLFWQIAGGGSALLVLGFIASRIIGARLAAPVANIEAVSEQNRARRKQAEVALELTSEELERTARYSADASHQLKSPVTILRAGLDMLLKRDDFNKDVYEELSGLLHQTYRLTGIIDDLLLLARMDAGRLNIERQPVDLGKVIHGWLDDFSALSEDGDVTIKQDLPPQLYIAGEDRYTSLIVQNLLENARKYNRPGGRIDISARRTDSIVLFIAGNTGPTISASMREKLFERFQRLNGEDASGHGLGLSVARELARLHGGDLRLVRSENDWTEFEVRFLAAEPITKPIS